jgi:exopolyphosphatase/guanosine-5'-triphosphate,3'-diphosphate pyrophosphatase
LRQPATARTPGARGPADRRLAQAISGEEEARLIYLAALHSIHLEGRRALVIDIGGGSVELALGVGATLEHTVSEKLGVLRISERFAKSDPLSPRDEQRLVEHIERSLRLHAPRIRESGFETAVGTSGTILALAALAREMEPGAPLSSLHHVTVGAEAIHALRKRLVGTDLRTRLKLQRLDESRADIIVTGAVILDTLLDRLGVRELVLCEWALREGILLDYIHGHPRSLARAEAYPDVRRRVVTWPSDKATRGTWRGWRWCCSTPPGAAMAWATPSARCSSTPRCFTTSATTSPTPATTSTRTT